DHAHHRGNTHPTEYAASFQISPRPRSRTRARARVRARSASRVNPARGHPSDLGVGSTKAAFWGLAIGLAVSFASGEARAADGKDTALGSETWKGHFTVSPWMLFGPRVGWTSATTARDSIGAGASLQASWYLNLGAFTARQTAAGVIGKGSEG